MGKRSEVVLPRHEHVPKDKRDDVVGWINAREARAREEAIAIEVIKNLQEKVRSCYRANPVTHVYKCADIVDSYIKLIRDPYRGVKTPGAGGDEA